MLRLPYSKIRKVNLIIAVHGYDIVVAGNSMNCEWYKQVLSEIFPVNNLDPLAWYAR